MRLRSGFETGQKGLTKSKSEESPSTTGTRSKATAVKEYPSISGTTLTRPKRTAKKESSSISRPTRARPKRTSKKESSTSGSAGARPKRTLKESSSASHSTGASRKRTAKKESTSRSTGTRPKRTAKEDCVQLSDSIWMFPKKKISNDAEIYEGELRSDVFDTCPIVLKLVENISQGTTEATILTKLKNHSHVLSQIHAGTFNFRLVDQIYIALDKCHHENLREFVTNRKNQGLAFDLSRAIEIVEQMVDGVKHIHENRIIHKDIKPDNILFSFDQRLIKIADFGISQEIDLISTEIFEKGQFGTDGFRPPESFGKGTISQKSDIFSLGVTFYFVLSNGEHLFGDDPDSWNYNMKNGKVNLSGLLVPNIKTTEHLIKSMIKHKINDRPTIWQVSEHPFWTGNEVSCDFDYHCPESAVSSLIPPTSEERSYDTADINQLQEHVKKIQLRDEAAAAKRTKDILAEIFDVGAEEAGIPQITDGIFINTKKPLRKGMNIYEGYQEHVTGEKLPLAIKVIAPFSEQSIREVNILVKLPSHPNVVRLIYSKVQQTPLPTLYIATELCSPITLQDYLNENYEKKAPFDFKKAMSYSKGLIRGMKHIHEYGIIHRDLKPQNIVFSLKGDQIKVTDFGISKQLRQLCSATNMTGGGTHGYQAPETYNYDTISLEANIFSLGVTLYSLFTNGKHPFGEDSDLWMYNIKKNKGHDLSGLPQEMGHKRNEFLNLLGNMLEFDPKKRPTMEEISEHPFFSDNQAITAQVSTKLEGKEGVTIHDPGYDLTVFKVTGPVQTVGDEAPFAQAMLTFCHHALQHLDNQGGEKPQRDVT